MTKTITPSGLSGSREIKGASPDAIMQLGFGYWASKTLLSAVEFGLFTSVIR
jgi:hypothetical protein